MSHRSVVHAIRAAGIVAAFVLVAPVARAQAPERWSVVLSRGKDTIAVERVRLAGDAATGDMIERMSGSRLSWQLGRDANGGRFMLAARGGQDAPNGPPKQRVDVTFTGDSAVGVVTTGTAAPVTRRAAAKPGAVPYFTRAWS